MRPGYVGIMGLRYRAGSWFCLGILFCWYRGVEVKSGIVFLGFWGGVRVGVLFLEVGVGSGFFILG